jgi:hypothetical protein
LPIIAKPLLGNLVEVERACIPTKILTGIAPKA